MVMLWGKIVEQGPKKEIFARPQHPYIQRLLAAGKARKQRDIERARVIVAELDEG